MQGENPFQKGRKDEEEAACSVGMGLGRLDGSASTAVQVSLCAPCLLLHFVCLGSGLRLHSHGHPPNTGMSSQAAMWKALVLTHRASRARSARA